MSNFTFIQDRTLRRNIYHTFDLRKTIIIHTAAIIEAILLWKLKQVYKLKKIELANDWRYYSIAVIHSINTSHEVVAGKRRKEKRTFKQLDFRRATDLCYKYNIIPSEKLFNNINKVRGKRNRQHLGGLQEIEKVYTRRDLEYCFNVLKMTKDIGRKN